MPFRDGFYAGIGIWTRQQPPFTNGGETAYLYTTGFDVDQVFEYSYALQEAGITKIDFEFNSGITDKLQDALDTLAETMTVCVKEV